MRLVTEASAAGLEEAVPFNLMRLLKSGAISDENSGMDERDGVGITEIGYLS